MCDRRRVSVWAFAVVLAACAARAPGPQPIAWDREPCTGCHMIIGERGFAAQVLDADGRARSFDDPGCLFTWLDKGGQAREIWLHHLHEDRWLRAPAVAFVRGQRSPMGSGLGAVDPGTAGAVSYADARRALGAGGAP